MISPILERLIFCPKIIENELLHVFHEGFIEEDNTFKKIIQKIIEKISEFQKSTLKKLVSKSHEIEKIMSKNQQIQNEINELNSKFSLAQEENKILKELINDLKSGNVLKIEFP